MAITLVILIVFIVLERYANRTDTKAVQQKRSETNLDRKSSYFS
jgi:hypothetical protein